MHVQLTRAIGRLRHKLILVGLLRGTCWGLAWIAAFGMLAMLADLFVVVPRPPRPVVAGLALAVLVATIVWMIRRERRPDSYLAHWLDVENNLDDRLASAFDFANDAADEWKVSCITQVILILEEYRLRLPRIAVGRLERPLLAVAGYAVLVALSLTLHRPHREADAKLRVAVPTEIGDQVNAIASHASALADDKGNKLAHDVEAMIAQAKSGSANKEEVLKQLANLRRELDDAEPGSSALTSAGAELPSGSVVKAAVDAVKAGDLPAAKAALAEAAHALGEGRLSSEEAAALGDLTRHLQQVSSASQSASAPSLNAASEAFTRGDLHAAAQNLEQASVKVADLKQTMERQGLHRELSRALQRLEQVARTTAATTGASVGKTPIPPGESGKDAKTLARTDQEIDTHALAGQGTYQGNEGRGSSSTGKDQREAPTPQGAVDKDLAVIGKWSGKTMREVVAGAAPGKAQPVLNELVAAHERVAEASLSRDDVPEDYRLAVRTYFDSIRRAGESTWKQ